MLIPVNSWRLLIGAGWIFLGASCNIIIRFSFRSNLTDIQKKQIANDETASDYGSGSPPSCDELLYTPPRLHRRRINTNFSNAKLNATAPCESSRYNFDAYFSTHCKCGKSGCESCGKSWLMRRQQTRDGDDFDVGVPIWSMDYMDNLIVVGCANGQIEFWEGTTGNLKVRGV